MPKDNPAIAEIPAFYKRQAIHTLLYGFISGVRWALPSISLREAAESFKKKYNLEEKYSTEDIVNTYNRINKDLLEAQKTT